MKRRLFIGIEITDEARKAAADHIRRVSEEFSNVPFNWISADKFHITLKFLGMTDDKLLEPIINMIDRNAASTTPFDIDLVGTGAFPNPSRPRVLWLGIKQPGGEMADLARRVDLQAAELGFESENRDFRPHLTLARIRDTRIAAEIGRVHASSGFGPIHLTCSELILYESHLGRESRYDKIHRSKFGN